MGSRPEFSREQPSLQPDEKAPAPGSGTQMNLLEQVLQQTALASAAGESLDSEALEALQEVARRYRGQPFQLEPVAVELVHASLSCQFPLLASPSRDWRAVSARIAQTLFEDPVAHDQLEALWKRLGDSV